MGNQVKKSHKVSVALHNAPWALKGMKKSAIFFGRIKRQDDLLEKMDALGGIFSPGVTITIAHQVDNNSNSIIVPLDEAAIVGMIVAMRPPATQTIVLRKQICAAIVAINRGAILYNQHTARRNKEWEEMSRATGVQHRPDPLIDRPFETADIPDFARFRKAAEYDTKRWNYLFEGSSFLKILDIMKNPACTDEIVQQAISLSTVSLITEM